MQISLMMWGQKLKKYIYEISSTCWEIVTEMGKWPRVRAQQVFTAVDYTGIRELNLSREFDWTQGSGLFLLMPWSQTKPSLATEFIFGRTYRLVVEVTKPIHYFRYLFVSSICAALLPCLMLYYDSIAWKPIKYNCHLKTLCHICWDWYNDYVGYIAEQRFTTPPSTAYIRVGRHVKDILFIHLDWHNNKFGFKT